MIVLGDTRYGKAEVRLLRVNRGAVEDEVLDLNVTIALRGDFGASYTDGDNSAVLTTDAQKNTVFAFAERYGVGSPEEFARLLAEHFTSSVGSVTEARVRVESYPWDRLAGHSFSRSGGYVRTASATAAGDEASVEAGLRGLTLLNTAGSQFRGFLRDEHTTLAETDDRILATDVDASWHYAAPPPSWDAAFATARDELIQAFAGTYSYSLQHTLFAMGRAVLERLPDVAEIQLALPNKHHFEQGSHDVYYASDRPYGLIEGTVTRGLWSSNHPRRSTTRSRSRPPGPRWYRWPAAPT